MGKRAKSAIGILAQIQLRLLMEGFGSCQVLLPERAPKRQRIGRNWVADIGWSSSSEAFDAALRAIKDVGGDFDCKDFKPLH